MILGKEHVGKKVRHKDWATRNWMTVEWLRDNHVGGVSDDGDPAHSYGAGDDKWELHIDPTPPQKPSERISELIGSISANDFTWVHQRISAVIKYLDEVAEKKGK
jgi:hypothetical protein